MNRNYLFFIRRRSLKFATPKNVDPESLYFDFLKFGTTETITVPCIFIA